MPFTTLISVIGPSKGALTIALGQSQLKNTQRIIELEEILSVQHLQVSVHGKKKENSVICKFYLFGKCAICGVERDFVWFVLQKLGNAFGIPENSVKTFTEAEIRARLSAVALSFTNRFAITTLKTWIRLGSSNHKVGVEWRVCLWRSGQAVNLTLSVTRILQRLTSLFSVLIDFVLKWTFTFGPVKCCLPFGGWRLIVNRFWLPFLLIQCGVPALKARLPSTQGNSRRVWIRGVGCAHAWPGYWDFGRGKRNAPKKWRCLASIPVLCYVCSAGWWHALHLFQFKVGEWMETPRFRNTPATNVRVNLAGWKNRTWFTAVILGRACCPTCEGGWRRRGGIDHEELLLEM